MADERNEEIEDVEAHKKGPARSEDDPELVRARAEDDDDEDVEAHFKNKMGPAESEPGWRG